MLPRAGHSQSRPLDQLGQLATAFGVLLRVRSTSCPGSQGLKLDQGCSGRAVTSQHARAAHAVGVQPASPAAPAAPGLLPSRPARAAALALLWARWHDRSGGWAGAASPGWCHPDEPRALRSSGVVRDKGEPALPASAPCQGVLAGAACPAVPTAAAPAGWAMGRACGTPGTWRGGRVGPRGPGREGWSVAGDVELPCSLLPASQPAPCPAWPWGFVRWLGCPEPFPCPPCAKLAAAEPLYLLPQPLMQLSPGEGGRGGTDEVCDQRCWRWGSC